MPFCQKQTFKISQAANGGLIFSRSSIYKRKAKIGQKANWNHTPIISTKLARGKQFLRVESLRGLFLRELLRRNQFIKQFFIAFFLKSIGFFPYFLFFLHFDEQCLLLDENFVLAILFQPHNKSIAYYFSRFPFFVFSSGQQIFDLKLLTCLIFQCPSFGMLFHHIELINIIILKILCLNLRATYQSAGFIPEINLFFLRTLENPNKINMRPILLDTFKLIQNISQCLFFSSLFLNYLGTHFTFLSYSSLYFLFLGPPVFYSLSKTEISLLFPYPFLSSQIKSLRRSHLREPFNGLLFKQLSLSSTQFGFQADLFT